MLLSLARKPKREKCNSAVATRGPQDPKIPMSLSMFVASQSPFVYKKGMIVGIFN